MIFLVSIVLMHILSEMALDRSSLHPWFLHRSGTSTISPASKRCEQDGLCSRFTLHSLLAVISLRIPWAKRSKKRFPAQQMIMLLGSLAHNVIGWARRWLAAPKLTHYSILRMVRDVFHLSGFLVRDASSPIIQIVLNCAALWLPSYVSLWPRFWLQHTLPFVWTPLRSGKAVPHSLTCTVPLIWTKFRFL